MALRQVTLLNARKLRQQNHRTWNQTNGTPVRAGIKNIQKKVSNMFCLYSAHLNKFWCFVFCNWQTNGFFVHFLLKICLLIFLFLTCWKNQRIVPQVLKQVVNLSCSEIRDCRHVQIFRHFCTTKNGQLNHQAILSQKEENSKLSKHANEINVF